MADNRMYVGRGASGLPENGTVTSEIIGMSDAAKRERALEQTVAQKVKVFRGPIQGKIEYLQGQIAKYEQLALEMDAAQNDEAARNYRRAMNYALMRINNLQRGIGE